MTFGQTLQKLRREKKITQRGIAQTIGMDYSYFSKLENDRFESKPTKETVEKIAEALGCTLEERDELFLAAGRIDEDLEKIIIAAQTRPEMNKLFRAAINLPREEIEEIIKSLNKEQDKTMKSIEIPSPSQYVRHDTVEEIATHFNKEYRNLFSSNGLCVDVESFADQYFQISILFDEIDEPEGARVFALFSDNISDKTGAKITLNTNHQKLFESKPQFLKSTIGHELGHYVLGHFKKLNEESNTPSLFGEDLEVIKPSLHRSTWKYNGLSSEELSTLVKAAFSNEKARKLLKMLNNKFEPHWMFYQAEHFSMSFLISKDLLVEKIETENYSFDGWPPVYKLAKDFDVTPSMMRVRLEKLGFLVLTENNKPANGPRLIDKKLF